MDIIGAEPRPPRRSVRLARVGARRLARAGGPGRRAAVVAVAVLAVAGAAALRSGSGLDQRPSALWTLDVAQPPDAQELFPLDRLPGRTPIPAPLVVGYDKQTVIGRLPDVGGPSRPAAEAATRLVLGRYCQAPATYDIAISQESGWDRVTTRAFRIDRGGYALSMGLRLVWIRSGYTWTGRLTQLAAC